MPDLMFHQDRVRREESAFGTQGFFQPLYTQFMLCALKQLFQGQPFPAPVDQFRQRIRILPRCRFGWTGRFCGAGGMNIVAGVMRDIPRRRYKRLAPTRRAYGLGRVGFVADDAEFCSCLHGGVVGWSYMYPGCLTCCHGRRDPSHTPTGCGPLSRYPNS